MKRVMAFLFILLPIKGKCQMQSIIEKARSQMSKEQSAIYLFTRGTKRKASLISLTFNDTDQYSTHAGLGFYLNGKEVIYHVSDHYNIHRSSLHVDSLAGFLSGEDVFYCSIWKLHADQNTLNKLLLSCDSISKRKISFDATFTLGENDSLYCSEFCAYMLKTINLYFQPSVRILDNSFYESVLQKKILEYYPVDFFQQDRHFNKIFEYHLKQF